VTGVDGVLQPEPRVGDRSDDESLMLVAVVFTMMRIISTTKRVERIYLRQSVSTAHWLVNKTMLKALLAAAANRSTYR